MHRRCRIIVSQFFREILHYTTLKSIPRLVVLFYKLLNLQLLERRIVNYFFICLITSHENIPVSADVKTIIRCLTALLTNKILYVGTSRESIDKNQTHLLINHHLYRGASLQSMSIFLVAYTIYLASSFRNKYIKNNDEILDLLEKILDNPVEVCFLALSFRNQFPEQELIKCRNFSPLSDSMIDNSFFKSLLKLYFDFELSSQFHEKLGYVIKALFKFHPTTLTIKNVIKKL